MAEEVALWVLLRHERAITTLLWPARGRRRRGNGRWGGRVRRQTRRLPVHTGRATTAVGTGFGLGARTRAIHRCAAYRPGTRGRAGRIPLSVGQRPHPAVAGQRGAFDVPLDHAGIGGPTNRPHPLWHRRDVSYLSLSPDDRRAGVRVARSPLPRPRVPRRRDRRAAQRASGHDTVRAVPRASRPLGRSHPAHQTTLEWSAHFLSGQVLSDQPAQALRRAAVASADLRGRERSQKRTSGRSSTATAGSARPTVSKTKGWWPRSTQGAQTPAAIPLPWASEPRLFAVVGDQNEIDPRRRTLAV